MSAAIDLRPITTFGVLGAGTLGWKIGLQASISGFAVLLHDIDQPTLATALQWQSRQLKRLVKAGRVDPSDVAGIYKRISTTADSAAFADQVDFVSESITERLELKRRVWGGFAGTWRSGTVLTTNTSYLLPSSLADVVGDHERFCAFHFHDVFDARVVDVMPHAGTHADVSTVLLDLGRRLNQIPVFIEKETPGYLFNAMLMAYLGAAGGLLTSGAASVEAIDRSWMGNLGVAIGPCGMMDMIGLDTISHVLADRKDKRSQAFRRLLEPMIAAGDLGVKTGRGFYSYPQPSYAAPSFLT